MQKISQARIFLIGSSLILALVSGCTRKNQVSSEIQPIYKELPALTFTPEEKTALQEFATKSPVLIQKIKGHSDYYATLIKEHNSVAKKANRARLEKLGIPSETLDRLYGNEVRDGNAIKAD